MRAKGPATNVLALLTGSAWAITEEALATMLAIASRTHDAATLGVEAIAAQLGRPLDNTHDVSVRDGVATIAVRGPMVRYASVFSDISGATSYERLATDLHAALADPAVHALLLEVDSPGGAVAGISELAQLVHDARGQKPIVAHVTSLGASAAYWLASAADEIVVADTAVVGSIGAVMTVPGAAPARPGAAPVYEFVSSQSPNKRLDPGDDAGKAAAQATVDALAQVFVDAVAKHRGVDVSTVLAEFGQGGVFVGADAVAAGLADRVSTYERVHAELAALAVPTSNAVLAAVGRASSPERPRSPMSTKRGTLAAASTAADPAETSAATTDQTPETTAGTSAAAPPSTPTEPPTDAVAAFAAAHPTAVAAWRAEGATAERTRIGAIQTLAVAGAETIVAEAVADASATPEATALRILQAQRAGTITAPNAAPNAGAAHLAALAADEQGVTPPAPLAPNAAAAATPGAGSQGEVARILATHRAVSQRATASTSARRA